MQQQSFIFLGRPGAGKGTQAQLLIKYLKEKNPGRNVIHIEPGAEFRKFIKGSSFTAQQVKTGMEKGYLMPEFMPIYIWAHLLVQEFTGNEHLVFDGAARKLLEAQALETAFPFYGLAKPYVIHLDIHHEESVKRLLLRGKALGRKDDDADAIERRRTAFEAEARPTIAYYKDSAHATFVDIDGIGSVEEVHARILKSLGLE